MLSGSLLNLLTEVAGFWKGVSAAGFLEQADRQKAVSWAQRKPPIQRLNDQLTTATRFEDWEDAAFGLDEILSADLWRQNAPSKYYDYRLIHERRLAIIAAQEADDISSLVNLLRSGLVRNLGNIASERLFNRAYAGTKILIEEYISQVVLAVKYVTSLPTGTSTDPSWTSQAKLDLLHDTRQAFGRSTVVLQGGAIFGICHLGVIRALHLRGLLPRIITGTASGALVAAFIGTKTEDELKLFLQEDDLCLQIFRRQPGASEYRLHTLIRSLLLLLRQGHLLELGRLSDFLQETLGNVTFEEAYFRTKRVLNITIPIPGRTGVPNLLNYLTAPNVLIWSAALASNVVSPGNLMLLCKDSDGSIGSWTASDVSHVQSHSISDRDVPLARVAELFNVNHFIVSQTRPYFAPFLRPDLQQPRSTRQARRSGFTLWLLRLASTELRHRLSQFDTLGVLPIFVKRLLVDEAIPGASVTVTPDLRPADFLRMLGYPSRKDLRSWIMQGERSVWPNVCQLRVRCAVEIELDRCYQTVRRRKPLDADSSVKVIQPSGASLARSLIETSWSGDLPSTSTSWQH